MKVYNAIFAKNLKRQLSYNQMNQTELAKKLGITPAAVSEWCLGKKTPKSLDVYYQLSDILGCTVTDLIGETEDLPEGAIPMVKIEKSTLALAKLLQLDPRRLPLVEALLKIPDEDLAKVAAVIAVFVQEDPNEEA